jgi:hypothetical protein
MQSDKRQLEPFMPMVIDGTKAVLEAATSAAIVYPAVLILQARAALPVVSPPSLPRRFQANAHAMEIPTPGVCADESHALACVERGHIAP